MADLWYHPSSKAVRRCRPSAVPTSASAAILPPGTVLPNGVTVPTDNATFATSSDIINGTPYISVQPVLTCDPSKNLAKNQYINGNCFAAPTPGPQRPYRDAVHQGPGILQQRSFAVQELPVMGEAKKIQFRVSAFNFLNHPLTSFNPARRRQQSDAFA